MPGHCSPTGTILWAEHRMLHEITKQEQVIMPRHAGIAQQP